MLPKGLRRLSAKEVEAGTIVCMFRRAFKLSFAEIHIFSVG